MIRAIRDMAAAWILAAVLIGGIAVFAMLRNPADSSPSLRRVDVSVRGAVVNIPEGGLPRDEPLEPPTYYTVEELFMERLE